MPIPDKIAIARQKYDKQLKTLQDYAASGSQEEGFEKNLIMMLAGMIELKTEIDILEKVMKHQAHENS